MGCFSHMPSFFGVISGPGGDNFSVSQFFPCFSCFSLFPLDMLNFLETCSQRFSDSKSPIAASKVEAPLAAKAVQSTAVEAYDVGIVGALHRKNSEFHCSSLIMELVSSQHYPVFAKLSRFTVEALCLRGSWGLRSRATVKCEAQVGERLVIFGVSLRQLLEENPWRGLFSATMPCCLPSVQA